MITKLLYQLGGIIPISRLKEGGELLTLRYINQPGDPVNYQNSDGERDGGIDLENTLALAHLFRVSLRRLSRLGLHLDHSRSADSFSHGG